MVTPVLRAVAGVAGLVCVWANSPHAVAAQDGGILRIATAHDPSSPAGVLAGIRFGADEIAHTARLVGRQLQVMPSAGDASARIETSSDMVSIVVAAGAEAGGAPCRFHFRPTESDRRAALDRWRTSVPAAPNEARLVEWHPTLEKYGAAQLNDRFTRATHGPMDAGAWVGWMAVKALGEGLLRSGPGDLCGTLRRQALDGHKGQPLRFDPASHHLRQPLYVATAAMVLHEVEAP